MPFFEHLVHNKCSMNGLLITFTSTLSRLYSASLVTQIYVRRNLIITIFVIIIKFGLKHFFSTYSVLGSIPGVSNAFIYLILTTIHEIGAVITPIL